MRKYTQIIELLEEYKQTYQELEELSQSWQNGNEHERAAADPGRQYALELELEEIDSNIVAECEAIVAEAHDCSSSIETHQSGLPEELVKHIDKSATRLAEELREKIGGPKDHNCNCASDCGSNCKCKAKQNNPEESPIFFVRKKGSFEALPFSMSLDGDTVVAKIQAIPDVGPDQIVVEVNEKYVVVPDSVTASVATSYQGIEVRFKVREKILQEKNITVSLT